MHNFGFALFCDYKLREYTSTPVGGSSCEFRSPTHLIPHLLVFYQRSYAFLS